MAEKVTQMVLKVDLQCPSCYKKVKRILSKFPEIRDQEYNEKANMVKITVVCCNPEKIRDKLCCKGDNVIKSIEIKKPLEKHEQAEEEGKPGKQSVSITGHLGKPDDGIVNESDVPPIIRSNAGLNSPPAFAYPPFFPVRTCCGGYYGGCPCYHGYGYPQPCYCGCGGYICGYGHAHRFGCHHYYTEENPQSCSIL